MNLLCVMFWLKEGIFWRKVAHRISGLRTFHYFPKGVQIPHVIFETKESVSV